MAYINGNYTCFTPEISLNVNQVTAKTLEKTLPNLIEGYGIYSPPSGYDGFSEVKVHGVYYSEIGIPYTRKTRFKNTPEIWGENLPFLQEISFDEGAQGKYAVNGLSRTFGVVYITFEENCTVLFDKTSAFEPFNSVVTLRIKGLNADSDFDMWSGAMSMGLTNLQAFEVYEGWDYDTVLYNSDLDPWYITWLINDLAVVEGKSLFLGSGNIEKVSEDVINIAINKGWDVY